MIKLIKNQNSIFICFISIFFSYPLSYVKLNLLDKPKKQIKYKKARALQSKTAKQMAKVYEALEEVDEKGEPHPDMETVTEILTRFKK